jgi:hypothetical protein
MNSHTSFRLTEQDTAKYQQLILHEKAYAFSKLSSRDEKINLQGQAEDLTYTIDLGSWTINLQAS